MKQLESKYLTPWRILFLLLLTLVACNGDDVPAPEPLPQEKEMRILWDVQSVSMVEGRALIEDNADLKEACTVGSGNKAIGIWSAYERNGEVTKNVLGEDGDVSLVYNVNTQDDNDLGWTYGEEAAYWTPGAKYTFNAYFPKDAIHVLPSSDITTFVARYNTVTTQEDLMLAFTEVSTVESAPVNPVPLQLHHALAALKFQFRFGDGFTDVNDKLTAFWLENTTEQGLCMQGLLKFGIEGAGKALTWDLENSAYVASGTPFYQWADATGLPITTSTDNMATAYTTGSYAENNGWLLIIPQESDGTVDLCFQTKNGGDVVHRVRLPLKTGINETGSKDDNGTWFAPARRYAYSLLITPTAVDVTLGIAGWNELESSYDITF
jgi:hypothetical protein